MARQQRASDKADRVRDEFLDAIGQRIKIARVRAGLTQKQLAEKIDSSPSWVYLVEDGQQNVQVQSLRKVAEALDVSIHNLLPDSSGSTDEYGGAKETGEIFETVINDLTRSVGLLHKLNTLRTKR